MKPIDFDPNTEPKSWDELFALNDKFHNHAARAEAKIIQFPNVIINPKTRKKRVRRRKK